MKFKLVPLFILITGMLSLIEIIPLPVFIVNLFLFLIMIKQSAIKQISYLKFLALFITIALLWNKFHTFKNIEFASSFVFTLALLKSLELKQYRDYFNMLLIFVLLEACILIVNPSSLFLILSFVKMILFFYLLVKIKNYELEMLNVRRIFIISIPAILFSIALYVFFPRFTQGFFSTNSIDQLTSTSNKVINFEELSELKLSEKKLFTVIAKNKDDYSNNYWRVNILSNFKNKEWRSGKKTKKDYLKTSTSYQFDYLIKTENPFLDFIPSLDGKQNLIFTDEKINTYLDGTFEIWPPTNKSLTFSFKTTEPELTPNAEDNLVFKSQNPLDKKILEELSSFLKRYNKHEAIFNYFKSKKFEYSLKGDQSKSVQDFILFHQKGYCSHFASIYAYLLNMVNIKSRVVIGFQGGIINPFDQSIAIREKDSHAWVEYFDNNKWIRIDPTEFVTANRFPENNLFSTVSQNKYFLNTSFFLDYLENKLSGEFFNIDNSFQKKYFNNKTTIYLTISFIIFFIVAYSFFHKLLSIENLKPHVKKYQIFKKRFEKKGHPKKNYETAQEYMERLIIAFPEEKNRIEEETNKYIFKSYKL